MTTPPPPPAPSVDWAAAQRRAAAVVRPGPRVARSEALALVTELRAAARAAPGLVAGITGLTQAGDAAAVVPVHVVDRARWAEVNVQMFRHVVADLLPVSPLPGVARLAGEELGVVLGLLSTKVLGQFDPFTPRPGAAGAGRLVLVAPNVLHVERQLRLDPADFRLWVCLHEQTHAVQFAAAPWLAEHLVERIRTLVHRLEDPSRGPQRLTTLVESLPRVLRGATRDQTSAPGPAGPLLDVVLDAEERAAVDAAVAVMSLLEGHADVVMDAVGEDVVRSVRRIRASFEIRRDGRGPVDVLLRRVLGLDAKVAQYRTGAAFVRGVVAAVGHEGLNAVWSGPDALPSPAEIRDPRAWVRRVHG